MRLLIFPAAVTSNLFAMMVLMIGLSLFGRPGLAAEIGLVHGATVALFYALSGNARSLILSDSRSWAARILRLRLVLVLPLCLVAWLLCAGVVKDGALFISLLIVRRAAEWLAEVFLSEHELQERSAKSLLFFVIQGVGVCAMLASLLADVWVIPITLLWACSPLWSSLEPGLMRQALARNFLGRESLRHLLPHFGSTLAIGISVYVFRLFIVLLVGKDEAGDLFAAFALGGILGAVFSQALGPTMIRHEQRCGPGPNRLGRVFNALLLGVLVVGGALGICIWRMPELMAWTLKSNFFWLAVSCSLVGGVVMVQAQRLRLRLLQGDAGGDVFGSDVLANLILIGCVPLFFFGGGHVYLATLYLMGAVLSLAFYLGEDWTGAMKRHQRNSIMGAMQRGFGRLGQYRQVWMVMLVAGLFTPIFYQLANGIFAGGNLFKSSGSLALLPIPFSVVFCYLGIVFLGGYARARIALVIIFLTFVGMLLSVLLMAGDGPASAERSKLILLVQFVLPMFALILGVQFGADDSAVNTLAKVLLVVLTLVVAMQLVATGVFGERFLSSSALIFGVYQHLQYVPVIFAGAFLITLYALWDQRSLQVWLMVLAALMGMYTALSVSMLALILLLVGVVCFTVKNCLSSASPWRSGVLLLLVLVGGALGLTYVFNNRLVAVKLGFLMQHGQLQDGPRNLAERMVYWKFYFEGAQESLRVFLFGHDQAPPRSSYPSAHNYYLDFIYNFGFVAVFPLLCLVVLTCYKVLRNFGCILRNPRMLALAGVVVFLLLADNLLKVGMRQPYPGIISFFLWGMLLAGLSQIDTKAVSAGTQRDA